MASRRILATRSPLIPLEVGEDALFGCQSRDQAVLDWGESKSLKDSLDVTMDLQSEEGQWVEEQF